ncbi:ornithine cyclodeaminase family protein [Acidaminobacter hydrogenoformans]|uniref:Ornithine cyclodeaminase n=1 Tax=Acidaminobacter hydrogenoformans DSM 2784 TaxID=1120920 RepID=A0A1G5S615_9FIRM|nr:ornithine cyclodeaminase family protein [Acidaminobacter hydrogenoformans]SCZ81784.1 ornithine cyclodeaminase [Acidaminobacter hydrogenoformans DSM 2784]
MLFLNEKAMRSAISLPQVMDQVEDAYRIYASGDFFMPHRISVTHEDNTLIYMPSFQKDVLGTKYLTIFPGNPKKGLKYIDGLMLLSDGETGKILSIMDGSYLTVLRTGAVGGVGVRLFTSEDSHSLGVIGIGSQSFYQILYATASRDIRDVYLYNHSPKDYGTYISDLKTAMGSDQPHPAFHICDSAAALVRQSDIVITTTNASHPVIPDDPALLKGKHFIGIGSYKPDMREFPPAIWQLVDHVYTEMPYACEESGDLAQPIEEGLLKTEQVRYVGDLLNGMQARGEHQDHRPKPPQKGETTFFKSVGMGLLDLKVAQLLYTEAIRKGLGQAVDF